MKTRPKVAVLGGGNSALTMAADLALEGLQVSLCDLPRFAINLKPIMQSRQIEKYGSRGTEGRTGRGELHNVTTNLHEAVKGVDLIFIAVPAYAHLPFFKALIGELEDGQIVVVFPGNWGALRLHNLLQKEGTNKKVLVAETSRCMHICRAAEPWLGPARVRVIIERGTVQIAAMPGNNTQKVLDVLKGIYPNLTPARNVLETSLNNGNIVVHGPLVLMNAGWIEHTGGQFMIYRDGVTPAVGRAMDAIGGERDAVLQAFGIRPPARGAFYDQNKDAAWTRDPCETGPPDLRHRYISEDIPFGLVPLAYLADLVDVSTPISDAMVALSSLVNRVDYWRKGLTLKQLGLAGLDSEAITRKLQQED